MKKDTKENYNMKKRNLYIGLCLGLTVTLGSAIALSGCGSKAKESSSKTTEIVAEVETTKPVETVKPTEAPTEKPVEQVTQKPTEKPTEAPTEKPTEKPTQKPTEKPVEKVTQKPVVQQTEKPTQKPTQAPTQKPVEKVTEKPTQAPQKEWTPAPEFQEEDTSLEEDALYYATGCIDKIGYHSISSTYVISNLIPTGASEAELKKVVYSIGIDWKERAREAAFARFGTDNGHTADSVRKHLLRWGYLEDEVEYAVSKWSKNPPAKPSVDGYKSARSYAEKVITNKSGARGCLKMFGYTDDEIAYALQFCNLPEK